MVLNRRGQIGAIAYVLVLLIALVLWAYLAPIIHSWAVNYITTSGITGLEAFAWYYINLWIFLAICLSAFIVISFGGRQ